MKAPPRNNYGGQQSNKFSGASRRFLCPPPPSIYSSDLLNLGVNFDIVGACASDETKINYVTLNVGLQIFESQGEFCVRLHAA